MNYKSTHIFHTISVRVSPELHDQLKATAKREGYKNLTAFIRFVLYNEMCQQMHDDRLHMVEMRLTDKIDRIEEFIALLPPTFPTLPDRRELLAQRHDSPESERDEGV